MKICIDLDFRERFCKQLTHSVLLILINFFFPGKILVSLKWRFFEFSQDLVGTANISSWRKLLERKVELCWVVSLVVVLKWLFFSKSCNGPIFFPYRYTGATNVNHWTLERDRQLLLLPAVLEKRFMSAGV